MKLIIGLGNPGIQYQNTRHNAGYKAIDILSNYYKVKLTQKKFNGFFVKHQNFILAKPLTYMNLSGEFVKKLVDFLKIQLVDILVIYDDIAYEVGTLSLKLKGSSNGHNGIKSIINNLQTEHFARLKIGIGKPFYNKVDFVLGKFTFDELTKIKQLEPKIIQIVENFVNNDIYFAVSKFN